MSDIRINNFDILATSPARKDALAIISAGLNAIDTERVITSSVSITGETLRIKHIELNLGSYKRIRVIGFGKASCEAALALEKVLGSRITDGIIIDIKKAPCEVIASFSGTHPRPSPQNTLATRQIIDLATDTQETDLVLVVVSGGGSALLCGSDDECAQGTSIYNELLKVGAPIAELNVVRKHLSVLKGGGLANRLYPATVVGLIFCDVPGDRCEDTASGPTYYDASTVADAQAVLDKYNLAGFTLNETPKEKKYFERVQNVPLVSNAQALEAMAKEASERGYATTTLSASIYDAPEKTINDLKNHATPKSVVLGGGEVALTITKSGGSGGRCSYLALKALSHLETTDVFASIASDGFDNSPSAGAIVDRTTLQKVQDLHLDTQDHLDRFDSYHFFEQTGDLIIIGPTGANVSDLMLWLTE